MNTDNKLPDTNVHEPTVKLINCAYPHGIPEVHYMTLLSILAKDMSIRVLASVIAHLRGGHYSTYMSDVIAAISYTPDSQFLINIKEKLINCGYEEWLREHV